LKIDKQHITPIPIQSLPTSIQILRYFDYILKTASKAFTPEQMQDLKEECEDIFKQSIKWKEPPITLPKVLFNE